MILLHKCHSVKHSKMLNTEKGLTLYVKSSIIIVQQNTDTISDTLTSVLILKYKLYFLVKYTYNVTL
jgi:hypothetical protein